MEIMIVVAIIGILIAIAVPGFNKTWAQSRQRQCEQNLSRIDGAKEQWALEKNKAAGTVVTMEELLAGEYVKQEQKCPAGGTYTINEVGKSPECSFHGSLEPALPEKTLPSQPKEGSIVFSIKPNILQKLEGKKIVVEISAEDATNLNNNGRAQVTARTVP